MDTLLVRIWNCGRNLKMIIEGGKQTDYTEQLASMFEWVYLNQLRLVLITCVT